MPSNLALGLFLTRISVGVFFLVWAVRKVIEPEAAVRVFQNFYFSDPPLELLMGLGALQCLVILAFMAGALKRATYGLMFLMHLGSTASTWERLLDPYTFPNALFWAAVPLVFVLWMLYACRDQDTFLSLGKG